MFSRAVVATDLSPSSEGVIACASSLGALGITEAFLVYAIDLQHGPTSAEDRVFARQAEALEAAGITVHVDTPLGYAPQAITTLAAERDADIIVMGSHGLGIFHTGFSGSVSSDVVRLSTVPILLAPSGVTQESADAEHLLYRDLLQSLLIPLDVELSVEPVCEIVCGLARVGGVQLELLHVVPLSYEAIRERREQHARDVLEGFAMKARIAGADEVNVTIARGVADEVVASRAASGGYSLIVLAPGCHDTIDAAFGSVTSAAIRESVAPVLLAPPGCDVRSQGRGNT